jgi:hypothetical protein
MAIDFDAWARSDAARRFQCFDPYMTYAKSGNDRFVRANGKPGKELNPDTEALFRIGEEAFTRLSQGEEISEDEFKKGCSSYWELIDEFRTLVGELNEQGRVLAQNSDGQPVAFDITRIDETQVMSICWQSYSAGGAVKGDGDAVAVFREMFLFHALREIDNALIGMDLDGREAVVAAVGAANALSNAIAIESGSEKEQEIRRDMAYRGAIEKLKRDPKQAAKVRVKECWNDWQKKPTNYKGKSAFAKDMMAKFEELDSQAVITRWCGQWEKDAAK